MATSIINKTKTKLTTLTAILLILIGGLGSCREKEEPYIEEEETNFCSYLNEKDIDKTIPFINEFLSSLSPEVTFGRKRDSLLHWLNSQPCIDSAICRGMETSMLISFIENGATRIFLVNHTRTLPLEIVGFQELKQPTGDDFCLFVNEKDISKTIPIINEYLKWHFLWFSEVARMPQDLAAWLKSKPCILDVAVFDREGSFQYRIHFSFDANGTIKEYVLTILRIIPTQVALHGLYNPTPLSTPLYGTGWKLEGIVDAETGALRVLNGTANSYTVWFYDDVFPLELPRDVYIMFTGNRVPPPTGWYIALGQEISNLALYWYTFNYETGFFQIRIHEITSAWYLPGSDGSLYREILNSVHSFSLQDNTLKLYYDDKQNYLLYKPWSP